MPSWQQRPNSAEGGVTKVDTSLQLEVQHLAIAIL
jgi:hypothetical protein